MEGQEIGVHSPDTGQQGERHKDHRKQGEDFDDFVHFHRDQDVVGFFQRFNGFLGAFERVFHAAVRPVEHDEIMPVILPVEINAAGAQRFKDHALGLHDAPEIKDFHFEAGDVGHHFAFVAGENPGFQFVDFLDYSVDLGQDFFQKRAQNQVEDIGRVVHMAGFGRLAAVVDVKNLAQGSDLFLAAGDQKILPGDEIEFADFDLAFIGAMRVVQDNKKIIFELVQVRIVDGRNDGAGGQGMDFEFVLQEFNVGVLGVGDIHPSIF